MTFIIEKWHCRDDHGVVHWTETLEEAELWANERVDEFTDFRVSELGDNGEIEALSWIDHTPEPIRVEPVRARINYSCQAIQREGRYRLMHLTPHPWQPLTEDDPWRVVAVASGGLCECGSWQEIEGAPDAVAELVAKYPYRPAPYRGGEPE